MVSLQGPVICPAVRSKQIGVHTLPFNGPFPRARLCRSDIWGYRGTRDGKCKARGVSGHLKLRKCSNTVQCIFSSSSDGNGSMAENFNENNEDYINSSVIEAVEVRSGADGFMIKMRDGRNLRCVHNNPQGGHLPDYAPHPAIVLKMEDGTGLLLPIIVLEMPSALLMAAVRNVQIARPTMYQVMKNMIDKMGYSVKLVRVTKRVHEAYFAQLYLTKVGDETESVTFDLRPSDAINIAVRCKVPIQVNKYLAYSDGMREIESAKLSMQSPASGGLSFMELDRPSGQHCLDTEEFNIVCDLKKAIIQERYKHAVSCSKELEEIYLTVVVSATSNVNMNYRWKLINLVVATYSGRAISSFQLYLRHLTKYECNDNTHQQHDFRILTHNLETVSNGIYTNVPLPLAHASQDNSQVIKESAFYC
ncbi:hypothetical protein V6N13_005144 [Hibiscus sabdariffa]